MKLFRSNLAAGVAIGLVAFALAAIAREAGLFERADLAMHDRLVRATAGGNEDDRFVIVLESEADLRHWKFPLADDVFAELITRILDSQPAAVAIDKYRDVPVEPGSQRLAELLRRTDRVFWVKKFGLQPADDVPTPAALDARFAGCGDLVDDRDGMIRRALLYVDDGQRTCYSLGLALARHVAAQKGIALAVSRSDPDRFDLGTGHVRALEPCSGPYANVDTAGFQVALPSAAGFRARMVGLSDVLEGRVPAEAFRGKVVLFGSSAESLRDFFNIPSTAAEGFEKVPGVAVHAGVASYLLRAAEGRAVAVHLAPRSLGLALAALVALGAGGIACARRSLPATIAGIAVLAALLAGGVIALAHQGTYTGVTAPAVALALAFVAGVVRSGWLERIERMQLMSLFGRHVSPEVAADLWRRREEFTTHGAIRPRQIVATMLFLDIRGFTTVSEKLDPGRVVPWLNLGLTAIIGEVTRHRGVVTRFAGDAVMAVFGSPVAHETEAEHARDAADAIDAALAVGPALDRVNAAHAAAGLPPIRVRIGVNTGSVTQCSVGGPDRIEFTVLGDAVNTASRLESFSMEDAGETARVLIGEETFRLAGERYETRLVGEMPLKGKEKPVTLRQVLGKR